MSSTAAPTTTPALTDMDKDLLLAVLKHHMGQDLRRVVMDTLPHAYNAWVGRNVMATVKVSDLA
jgi:hypothetical protein